MTAKVLKVSDQELIARLQEEALASPAAPLLLAAAESIERLLKVSEQYIEILDLGPSDYEPEPPAESQHEQEVGL
jgi:hypothetical protein